MQAMLAAGADVNEKRPGDFATPLLMAIINGHEDLVDLLLEKGADPNAEGGYHGTDGAGQPSEAEVKIKLKTPSFREQLREVAARAGTGRTTLGPAAAGRRARRQLAHQRSFIIT